MFLIVNLNLLYIEHQVLGTEVRTTIREGNRNVYSLVFTFLGVRVTKK